MSSEPTQKKRAARRVPTQTIGEALGVADSAALFSRASDTTLATAALAATRKMLETGEHTIEEVLELPATVTNKRKIEKMLELPKKHADMINAAGLAVHKDLFPKITIAKAEAHAKELKEAERKRRQDARSTAGSAAEAKSSSSAGTSVSADKDALEEQPDAKKRKVGDADQTKPQNMNVDTTKQETEKVIPEVAQSPPPVAHKKSAGAVAKSATHATHNKEAGAAGTKSATSPNGAHKKAATSVESPKGAHKKAAAVISSPKGRRSKTAQTSK